MEFIIKCPHCSEEIVIEQINCGIFRHGIFKSTLQQIPPHSPKIDCDRFISENLIYGCGKPFEIKKGVENNYEITICEYI